MKSTLSPQYFSLILVSLVWMTNVKAQFVAPVVTNEVKLPVRLDQWLMQDLNGLSQGQKKGGFRLNLASKAWFCVKERELEEWSGVPVRFRLGDQPTVDRLEGK